MRLHDKHERLDVCVRCLLRLTGHERLVLVSALVGQSGGGLEFPCGDVALVKLVELPVGAAVGLTVASAAV